jgi:uncharacterized protein with von Willebrand factor type A (vWA) domain
VEGRAVGRDELLKMLDLAGKDTGGKDAEDVPITPAESPPASHASPTALELDDWGLRRGREVLAESERLRQTGLDEDAAADFHGAAFEPEPKLKEGCADAARHEFLTQLLQTPDYHALHQATLLDPVASSIAACAFAEQFAGLRQGGDTEGARAADAEMATLRAVGRAVSEAHKEVEECKEACSALGMGPGAPGSNDPRAIAALFRRVRNNPTLRRVCELAGRYRRLAQSKQRQKATHGVDDVVGVVLDGDVGRLLPHELAKLADDDLGEDAMRRLVERQLMCREYHATEPVARGPVIVCVDESGSMAGEKGHTAKALALALAWVARMQRRWIALCAYSGDSGERLLALPPGRWDESALMDWVEDFIGRGSSIDVPVREMPRIYRQLNAPLGKTDVIFLTDAQCRLPAELRQQFVAWKKAVKARLITLVIRSQPGDLSAISDEVFTVPALSVGEDAVGRVLSV